MKKCRGCHEYKDKNEFDIRRYKSQTVGFKSKCKACRLGERRQRRALSPHENNKNKEYNRIHAAEIRGKKFIKYWPGSTWQEAVQKWDDLYASQQGVCAICKNSSPLLHVDHCHSSGKTRGLLCYNCNNGLGRFKDNAEYLTRAIAYLSSL